MTSVAKAELHVHLEGTAPPELVGGSPRATGSRSRSEMLGDDGRFRYTDFLDFLRTYDLAASVIRTAEDYRDITYEYLCSCAAGGAIYVELTASPDHAALVGLSDEEHLGGIARGIDDARRDTGIEGRILISAVRNFGVEQALRVARHAAEHPHPYVVGFSMAGDEAGFPAGDFAEVFQIAAGAGLGCTIHAGEWAGAESVRAALELPVTRISHGVRAIEDAALVDRACGARDRARVLPDQQRRARRVSRRTRTTRCPSSAQRASGSRSGPTTRRTSAPRSRASTRCAPRGWASARTFCARSPPPRSTPRSATTSLRATLRGRL